MAKKSSESNQPLTYEDRVADKNQYGVFELKRVYQKYFSRGLIIAVILHVLFISGYTLTVYIEKLNAEKNKKEEEAPRIIKLEDLDIPPPTKEDVPPPPDVDVPKTVIPLKDLEALVPEPVAKKEAEVQTIKTQQQLENIKAPVSSTGSENAPNQTFEGKIELQNKKVEQQVEKKEVQKEEKKKDIYTTAEVEKAPSPVNLGSVRGSMRYPEIARQSGMEGRVVAKVLVGTDGSVIKVGGVSGPSVFQDEVSDKVMSLKFTPALQNGQPVKCWVSVPFSFTLSAKDKQKSNDEGDKGEEK
jgi:protein TonB